MDCNDAQCKTCKEQGDCSIKKLADEFLTGLKDLQTNEELWKATVKEVCDKLDSVAKGNVMGSAFLFTQMFSTMLERMSQRHRPSVAGSWAISTAYTVMKMTDDYKDTVSSTVDKSEIN